jgi:hypothetical protein
MDGLQLRWLLQHFLRVHSSRTKSYVKYSCATLISIRSLLQMQQFVLLIQQVQAPEDLASALPPPSIPSPQAASPNQPPSSGNTPIAPTNAVPPNAQDANANAPPQESVSFFSIVRFILQLAWYDDHNRICTFLPPSSRWPLNERVAPQGTSYSSCSPS